MVFDTHTHAVSPDLVSFPRVVAAFPTAWLEQDPPSAGELEVELAANAVSGAVLVQPQGAYDFDNRYILDAARQSPMLRPVVSVDMTAADRAAVVEALADAGAVGVRLFSIPTPEQSWLADPDTFDAWTVFHQRSLVVSICCLPPELAGVARAAARSADVTVVLDHCGFVDLMGGTEPLDVFADLDNVNLKITGHVLHDLEARGADTAVVVAALADRVGTNRLVWGSDWPQTGLSYAESVAMARRASSGLSPEAADRFLGATARSLYGRSMV